MKPYTVILKRSAARELDRLPDRTHDTIIRRIRGLETDPRSFGAEKLTGIDAYKLRVGSYRIIYEIDDKNRQVRIVMVDDRKQIYKRLKRKR